MLIKILFQQVSYLPDDVDGSDLYYHTVPSNAYIVDALISLCHMFQWYKVGVFTSNEDHYIQVEYRLECYYTEVLLLRIIICT